MKKQVLLFLYLVLFIPYIFCQNLKPTEEFALAKIKVTDFELIPSQGDKVLFCGKKTDEVYRGVSDVSGCVSILVRKGDIYEIRCQSIESDQNYSTVEIPDAPGLMTFEVDIKYQLPKIYTLENVYFDSGKHYLRSDSGSSLDNLAELMQLKKKLKIEIAGHTDDVGEDDLNLNLSQKRAESVRNYLIKKGIAPQRIIAKGYGETQPIAQNLTEQGKQENRRTEVRIISQ